LFNVFINDIFPFVKNGNIYNYAEDLRRATEWGDTPYADNLSSKILWGRQPKALERSISTAAMY
jgi:hypothetical protein